MNDPDKRQHTYIAIDLKSFYASVECLELGLDPLDTNLVVADASRTNKTICLAVSPSLKAYGISGRARLFEVEQRMKEVNQARHARLRDRTRSGKGRGDSAGRTPDLAADPAGKAPAGYGNPACPFFTGRSCSARELAADPTLEIGWHVAVPRMAHYIEVSTKVYEVYLRYIAPEDIHVYSIDEVMMDVTKYLQLYGKSAHELAKEMIRAVLQETGITAAAGIGTNLYLCKIAMDIEAKHTEPDEDGVRIAELDEMSYRRLLWGHRPITDFWRVGRGYARRLARYGIFTMGDVARWSLRDEDLLYDLFGVNAELLIDHAWGYEPCTMEQIKSYRPKSNSFSSGQVLPGPYSAAQARIVVREMAEAAALDLVEKNMLTDQMTLTVGYDIENLRNPALAAKYSGPVHSDFYGRTVPRHAHGTANLGLMTNSSSRITAAVLDLYDRIVDPDLLIRRFYLNTNHVKPADAPGPAAEEDPETSTASGSPDPAGSAGPAGTWEQLDLFTDYEAEEEKKTRRKEEEEKERRLQEAMLTIRRKFGKNAILKGTSLQEDATMRQRNESIGGHKA